MRRASIVAATVCLSAPLALSRHCPGQAAPAQGIRPADVRTHAIVGATVHVAPGRVIEDATIVMRDGVIEAVGKDLAIPAQARRWPGEGLTVYAGLIDAAILVDVAELPQPGEAGAHWNGLVHPQVSASGEHLPDAETRKAMRELGFTAAAVYPSKGILRGSGAVVALAEKDEHSLVYLDPAAMAAGFDRGSGGGGEREYPTAMMGAIALLRQTFLDAAWHARCAEIWRADPAGHEPPMRADALESLAAAVTGRQPVLFDAPDELVALRAARLARELDLQAVLLGSGYEFRRLQEIAGTKLPVIVPIKFPKRPSVSGLPEADEVSLRDMLTWEQAPTNPRRLVEAGVTVVLTTHRLEKRSGFHEALHRAIAAGLTEEAALSALTVAPARVLGVDGLIGTIEPGKAANLVVVEGSLFERKPAIRDVWINGRRHEVTRAPQVTLDGQGTLSASFGLQASVTFERKESKLTVEAPDGSKVKASDVALQHDRLQFALAGEKFGIDGFLRLSGLESRGGIAGSGVLPSGEPFTFTLTPAAEPGAGKDEKEDEEEPFEPVQQELVLPFGAFGLTERPRPRDLLLENATIWTCGPEGVIVGGSMLVVGGRIERVGRGPLPAVGAGVEAVDLQGRHVTPGLIDCHSHTAIDGGVNEFGQAISAEVRIEDVIDPDDINLYRELAGGLTAANLLHGSANPIGGQSCTIKLRWSAPADELPVAGAPAGIKFALGENVKRSRSRYPNTRMGVEAIIRDALLAARDYQAEWLRYDSLDEAAKRRTMPPRRDLELDALVEILQGERRVHCHSYRQDEILMLLRLAEEIEFTVGTLQHVLEGYKVADAIASHGAGASSFSDWWAYKAEVMDAIPYHGALMHDVGVLVSFNSDSSELARRMNGEAAKAVRYGGVDPQQALGFVTINPARQLGVDDRIGTLEPGKDADFAVWSESPLSTYARCEQTWIEGARYFDLETDLAMRQWAESERQRLIQKILRDADRKAARKKKEEKEEEDSAGEPAGTPAADPPYSCCREVEP